MLARHMRNNIFRRKGLNTTVTKVKDTENYTNFQRSNRRLPDQYVLLIASLRGFLGVKLITSLSILEATFLVGTVRGRF